MPTQAFIQPCTSHLMCTRTSGFLAFFSIFIPCLGSATLNLKRLPCALTLCSSGSLLSSVSFWPTIMPWTLGS